MTHYTTHYSGNDTAADRERAIADIRTYLGDKFDMFEESLRGAINHEGLTLDRARFLLSFAGIEGYPVKAWYNTLKEVQS